MYSLFLISQLILMYFFNELGLSLELNAYIFLFLNIIFISIYIFYKYYEIKYILISSYFLRLIFMFWDIYAKKIFLFPNSGNDTEGFYNSAISISNNIKLIKTNLYGGLYSKFLGAIFYFIGDNRIVGQYLNVIFGLFTIIYIYKILLLLDIKTRNIFKFLSIISFMPNALMYSAILLRESIITMVLTISIYYFITWIYKGLYRNQIISIMLVLLASSFHSGVIGILIGYLFIYMFYNRTNKTFEMTYKSVAIFFISIVVILIIFNKQDMFLGKFSKVENIDDVVHTANKRKGGAQYLVSLQINTWWKILLYAPVYMIYFTLAPLPWDWRGIQDILTFLMDSFIYLYLIYTTFKNRIKIFSDSIYTGLILSSLATIFLFGIGVSNAGTAMRHRHKILPLLIILTSYAKQQYKQQVN